MSDFGDEYFLTLPTPSVPEKACNFYVAMGLISKIIKGHQESVERTPSKKAVKFVEYDTNKRIQSHIRGIGDYDLITFKLEREEPATSGGPPFEGGRSNRLGEQKMPIRDDETGEVRLHLIRQTDCLVRFNFFGEVGKDAEALLQWFHNLWYVSNQDGVLVYRYILNKYGINIFQLWDRSPDEDITNLSLDISNKSVRYWFRLQERRSIPTVRIDHIDVFVESIV